MGKIGRLGNTWVLTLTRIERATATARDRAKIQQQGPAVDVLLPRLGEVIDEVFRHGRPVPDADVGISPLVTAGVGGLVLGGVGLVGLAAGAVLLGLGAAE